MKNNSNYYEYLHTKIQDNDLLKKEVEHTKILIEEIESQISKVWMSRIYYLLKRAFLFLIIILLGYLLVTTFSNNQYYIDLLNKEVKPILSESYNETFGRKLNISGSYSDPFMGDGEIKALYRENLNSIFLNKIITEDIFNIILMFRIVIIITIIILAYISSLTKKLYRKNKLIEKLYQDQIQNLKIFEQIYDEQKLDIEKIKNF